MADPDRPMKPHELAKMGLIGTLSMAIGTLSMADFELDQRLVDEVLGIDLNTNQGIQQGGVGDTGNSTMRPSPFEPGGNRGAVPFGQLPGQPG